MRISSRRFFCPDFRVDGFDWRMHEPHPFMLNTHLVVHFGPQLTQPNIQFRAMQIIYSRMPMMSILLLFRGYFRLSDALEAMQDLHTAYVTCPSVGSQRLFLSILDKFATAVSVVLAPGYC
jgi:hypothetical protein